MVRRLFAGFARRLTTEAMTLYCLTIQMMPKSSAPSRSKTTSTKGAQTAIERVAQRLEDLVRAGDLRRGSRLRSEPRLAALLGVSRASLRKATKALVCMGLLKARAGDGTYLQPTWAAESVDTCNGCCWLKR